MNYTEIVMKLIGPINPIGRTEIDNETFKNLLNLCNLVDDLVAKINNVSYNNLDAHEYSIKRSADYAADFLTKTLGIKE